MTEIPNCSLKAKIFLILIIKTFYTANLVACNTPAKWNGMGNINTGYDTLRIDPLQSSFQSYEEDENNNIASESEEAGGFLSEISYRLPNTTHPLHYFLHITTNIHRGIFDYNGNCTIEIMVLENTNELVLHANNLNIFKILVDDLTARISVKNLSYRIKNQMLIIFCTENENDSGSIVESFMRNHRLRLEIHYSSVISAETVGFYQMTYRTKEGALCIGASTQFEPTYARNVLPCYDEPQFKSIFTVQITHGSNFTAISNMPDDGNPMPREHNMTTTTFLETPLMSVYLLVFVISNFKHTSMQTEDLVQRAFFPPDFDRLNTTQFLTDAVRAIRAFEELVDIPYHLPKLDHAILNESYGKGMENWGLITYSNDKFRKFSPNDTQADYDVLEVLTHEIVHQWTGNLVTPEWWTYIWLSEGFATYYGRVLMDILRPEHKALQFYQLNFCNGVRSDFDQIAVTKYVERPLHIIDSFDRGVYLKAGCIIQMFEHAFGKKIFQKGLSKYLKAHAYSTADEGDFFDVVQAELVQQRNWNKSVHQIMNTWFHSQAYPLIRVTRNYDNQSSIIHIKQTLSGDGKGQLFWIPLNFVTSKDIDFENTSADIFMPPVEEFMIDLKTLGLSLNAEDWLLVNKKGTGFYGVSYDQTNMRLLTKALRTDRNKIHSQSRVALFYDLSNDKKLTQTTEDVIMLLELMKYLRHEDDPFVWISALPVMENLKDEFQKNYSANGLMQEFLLHLILPPYETLNNISTTELSMEQIDLLENLEFIACKLDVDKCLLLKKHFVMKFILGEHNSTNETMIFLCSAAKIFNPKEYEMALDYIVGQNKLEIWYGLSCTRNETLYRKFLEKVFDVIETMDDEQECADKLYTFAEFLTIRKSSNQEILWTMFRENIPRILKTPCVDAFYKNLSDNLVYIDKSHKEELRYIYEQYFKSKGIADVLDETLIGTNIIQETKNTKIIAHVVEWLKNELQKNTPDIMK